MQYYHKLRKRRLVYSYQIQWFYTLQALTAGSSQAVFEHILESETGSRYLQNLNNQFNAIFFNQPQNTKLNVLNFTDVLEKLQNRCFT